MNRRVKMFAKRQALPLISLAFVIATAFVVPPSSDYADYIDWRTICLLFCLMASVAGMASCGVFESLARTVLSGYRGAGVLCLLLVLLPWLCAMFVTNDVALITFVPFAIIVLEKAEKRGLIIPVVVLQTLGANTGSMIFPFGNPHNLFVSSKFDVGFADVVTTMLPLAITGLLLISAIALLLGKEQIHADFERTGVADRRTMIVSAVLFAVAVASVVGWIPYQITTVIVLVLIFIFKRQALARVDYGLLFTFVCLFVFAGNVGNINVVRDCIEGLISESSMLTTVLFSQIISNVPSTVLLSNFTDDWQGLLIGADIGGFGTPIASMASLISLRFYAATEGANVKRYLTISITANILMLAVLIPVGLAVMGRNFIE